MSNPNQGAALAAVTPVAPNPVDEAQFHLGFERLEGEIRAFPLTETIHINLDVLDTVSTVLGVVKELEPFRDTMTKLPEFDFLKYENLRDYALALKHTQGLLRVTTESDDGLAQMAREASELHDTLHTNAVALARFNLVDKARLSKVKRSGNSFKAIGFDLVAVAQLLLDSWDQITGSTPIQRDALMEARLLGNRLVAAAGVREQQTEAASAASTLRSQAFTLLVQAYDEVRRAMHFLRWRKGDADDFTPSLWAGRGGRGQTELPIKPVAKPPEGSAETSSDSAPNSDAAAAGDEKALGMPAAAAGSASTAGAIPVPPGFPGAPPFVRP